MFVDLYKAHSLLLAFSFHSIIQGHRASFQNARRMTLSYPEV
jgi:hypothetical protein